MGRTGSLFAYEQEGICGDIVAIAKGLGAGYQPIGAAMVHGKIHEAIKAGSGFFQHGHTYLGHAIACASSLKVQQIIQKEKLLENVVKTGNLLQDTLRSEFGKHEFIGQVRGRGMFIGVEIVKDKATKAAFDPALKINAQVKATAMQNGLCVYGMPGTIDGRNGDHIMFATPFILNEAHVDEIVDKFGKSLTQVFESVAKAA
jgi:adenosylmethionine-8-amino-7-oxononanoate aminotransferase